MTWQRSKRIAKYSLKWFNWTVVLPSLALVLLLTLLLYTAPGLRLNLWLAEAFLPGLTVEQSEGSLLGGHTLYNVHYQQEGIEFTLQRSELVINNRCLLALAVCADKLALTGLQLRIAPGSGDDTASSAVGIEQLWLPFPLTISQFNVDNGQLDVIGHQLLWHSFTMGVKAWGNKVQLSEPRWAQVELTLATPPATNIDSTAFSYQPPELTDFNLPLSLFINQFQLTDLLLRQQNKVQQLKALSFTLQWQKHQLELTQFEASHILGDLQGAAKVSTTGAYPMDVSAQLQVTQGEFTGQQLQLGVTGELSALQLDAKSQGPITAELAVQLNLLQSGLPHDAVLTSEHLQWPVISTQPQIQLTRSQLRLSGDLQHSLVTGRLSVNATSAPDAAAEFSGHANLAGLTLDKLIIDTLGGQISASTKLNWQQNVSWQSQTRLRHIQPGLYWPDYAGVLNGELQHSGQFNGNGSWQIDINQLNVNGMVRDYALALTGSVTAADLSGLGDYQFSTPQLQLLHADNSISVRGSVQHDWRLALQLAIPALEQSVANAYGNLNGEFTISGARLQPELNGELSAAMLSWQDLSLEQLKLKTTLWLDKEQKLNARLALEARQGIYQQQQVQQLNINVSGNEQQHQLTVAVKSVEHQANLQLQGSLTDQRLHWQGELQQVELNSLLGHWQLVKPTLMQYSLAQQKFSLATHCWQQNSSNICLSNPLTISRKQAQISAKVSQFDLATLAAILPPRTALAGLVDAQLSARWQQGEMPKAMLSISSDNGRFTQQLETLLTLDWQRLTLHSSLADDQLHNSLDISFDDAATLSAKIQLGQLQSGGNTLAGELKLQQFALGFLQPLLTEFSELSGKLSSDLTFAGSLQQPLLDGQMDISQLRVKGKLAPVDVDNADIALRFSGQQASLSGLITTPKGEIALNGDASWQQLADWKASINIKGDELKLQVPQARLHIAPNLTVQASQNMTRVTGSVTIPVANINIDSLPQNAVELSDDLVLLDEKLQPVPQEPEAIFALQTDIKVILGNKVKLQAFGLTTLLNGSLRVRQRPERALRINGDVNLQDGTFRAYGQDLLIRKGKMNFNGPADQPFLHIEAIRNPDNMEDDVIAGIRVNGPADDPSVVIFSEPAKAQANALSYLLMGRDLDSSSGNTGNAVTTGLIGMTLSSSSKVVGELGEAFGLQDLTLDTAGAGDNSQVTVSGYLSRDLQLKYGYGIFNAVGEFTLRYRLMRRLYLEAVSGLDNAVDLLYKFEFD
jgi:translocation and assembly module TamB